MTQFVLTSIGLILLVLFLVLNVAVKIYLSKKAERSSLSACAKPKDEQDVKKPVTDST